MIFCTKLVLLVFEFIEAKFYVEWIRLYFLESWTQIFRIIFYFISCDFAFLVAFFKKFSGSLFFHILIVLDEFKRIGVVFLRYFTPDSSYTFNGRIIFHLSFLPRK